MGYDGRSRPVTGTDTRCLAPLALRVRQRSLPLHTLL